MTIVEACESTVPLSVVRHPNEATHYIRYYLMAELTSARYGKTKVRVFRVVREDEWHHVVEYNVEALLEGDIATR